MDNDSLRSLLEAVRTGGLSPADALQRLRWQPVESIGDFAQLDHHRALRQGMPEFVYAAGKSPEQVAAILAAIVDRAGAALASRVSEAHYEAVRARLPRAVYHPVARLIT